MTTPLEEALYSGTSLPEVLDIYSKLLREDGSFTSLLHSNKLTEYKNIINVSSYYATLRKIFDKFYTILDKELPQLRFRIAGRRKSFISVEQKIRDKLENNESLDLIRDLMGVRIILLNGDITLCYTVLEKLIQCCLKEGFTICEVSNSSDKNSFNSSLLNEFYYGIKDYIKNPKESGYQSLHATFRNINGFCFEVQVRTFNMHCNAVNGNAKHTDYRNSKYKEIKFDRSKIIIPGYSVCSNGAIMDLVGLEHALEVFQRNKSF